MEIQAGFHNYLAEEMIDNTYARFVIRRAEGRRRTVVDYDDDYINDEYPLFGLINGATRCGISLYATTNKKSRKNRYGTYTKCLLLGECNVCQKKTMHVCLDCTDTEAVKN